MKTTVFSLFLMLTMGCVHAGITTVGNLSIEIPAGFKSQDSHAKDSLGNFEINRWGAKDGRIIEVLYFVGQPEHDRGPMVIAHEDAIEVVGQKTKLIETEVFL